MKLSRRTLLRGAVAAAPLPVRQAAAGQRPNVIVILFDDLGLHDLGFLEANDLRTPHIDRLASSGMVCRNWYSNAPVCAPARSALMTGRNPLRAGVPDNGRALRPTEKTIASLLKENGYETGLIGKWHLGSSPDTVPNAHGFDYFYGFHEGCVDYYSHRYYWGEPKRANFHDLWRNRTGDFRRRPIFDRAHRRRGGCVHRSPAGAPPSFSIPRSMRCTIPCTRRNNMWSVSPICLPSGACTRPCWRRRTIGSATWWPRWSEPDSATGR